ncbi:polyphenol oxidase I, chloroplastic-like protein [Tanacetum coccineum]|uniref:Polyphenol oxidase I, chloroplastic-like protein n=1 Tax=Tanacetum coccineum TaxID=301880 RepID=A0ABQ5IWI5_9ASTR
MMASLSLSTLPTTTTTKKTNTWSRSPLFSKPSPRRFKVSCNAAADDDHKTSETPKLILPKTSLDMQNVDRRNLLLGLGGIYGATNLASVQSALAYPMTAPDDIRNCFDAHVEHPKHSLRGVHCCPKPPEPYYKPKDYMLPVIPKPRIRPAAQRVTAKYIKDYEWAIEKMKSLDDDDPHSWNQQAKIHCAYCNDAYIQGNNKDSKYRIQIHSSSLFFPFHRWYLYFYERILGKLLHDDTFALPYWNWDHPTGMMIPGMYEAAMVNKHDPKKKKERDPRNNHLFDGYRNVKHLPPVTMDLNHFEDTNTDPAMLVHQNLSIMRRQMKENAQSARFFFGKDPSPPNPYPRTSEPDVLAYRHEQTAGSIESPIHNVVHNWTGNPRLPMGEDMGDFYSAGYDPIFFAHHANVDRMWTIWKDLDHKNKEPKSDDWLNASYVSYDENRELVRVYNKDCVDTIRMGYKYEDSPIPWKDYKSLPANSVRIEKSVEDMEFPVKLDKVVKITASESEFAGSFTAVAHHHGGKMFATSGAVFGITQLLEDLEAEDDEDVLVSLVPRTGADDVTISEIKIELVLIDD